MFTIVNNLRLIGSRWALILPYVAGQQILGVILLTSFIHRCLEMFEAARIGANSVCVFAWIGLSLSVPTLITVA